MDSGDDSDETWAAPARERYLAQTRTFLSAVEAHVALTAARIGRHAEVGPYFDSLDRVRAAAEALNDAEFGWCGSIMLPLTLAASGLDDELQVENLDDADAAEVVLSLKGSWEFEVQDVAAVVLAGRGAYLRNWPGDLMEDAESAVTDVVDAGRELMHRGGVEALNAAEGLQLVRNEHELGVRLRP